MLIRRFLLAVVLGAAALSANAQGALLPFGSERADGSLPVEITADALSVDQETGAAVFEGNVVITQGEIRLSADRVFVVYKSDRSGIERLEAKGSVMLVNGPDAAEAELAEYSIDTGAIEMTGDVLLTQGASAIRAERMMVNLDTGMAQMSGRVTTVLTPGGN